MARKRSRKKKEPVLVDRRGEEGVKALEDLGKFLSKKTPDKRYEYIGDGATGQDDETTRVVNIRTKPICWGFPFDEVLFSKWAVNMLMLRPMPWDDIITCQNTYLPEARNKLHSQFVTESDSDWLMMLDSDVCPPPDIVDVLLKHHEDDPKKKMIGGWYRKKAEPFSPVVYEYVTMNPDGIRQYRLYKEEEIKTGSLESITGAGAGVWLMHREIAEKLGEKPYDMEHGGEDLRMCEQVLDLGYEIWIDWNMACAHVGVGVA